MVLIGLLLNAAAAVVGAIVDGNAGATAAEVAEAEDC